MELCNFDGNADMYGLGIRLGYYLQWYGGILASLLAPKEVSGARFALALFISATFLALIIQTAQRNLYIVEVYIILLLTFGAYISLVPLFLWRLVTGCNPLLDPSRFPIVKAGSTYSDLHALLLLAVAGFQMWFWITKIPELDGLDCPRYGLIFAKVRLNDLAFQVVNIVLYFIIGVTVLVLCAMRVSKLVNDPDGRIEKKDWDIRKSKYEKQWLDQRIDRLHWLGLSNNFITASIIVVATELTIRWNRIANVNDVSSAGQLIPYVIGLGVVVRVLHVWRKRGYPLTPNKPRKKHRKPTSKFQTPVVHSLPTGIILEGRPHLSGRHNSTQSTVYHSSQPNRSERMASHVPQPAPAHHIPTNAYASEPSDSGLEEMSYVQEPEPSSRLPPLSFYGPPPS